ncbi:MAG: hypothetical protein JRN62_03250 [Nitrososphaerota archaeon]|jgi:hypothetical protein|nr:hypothetical protein [Nitrososphaerota archaeon]MDG6948614.1 hypothetical protein [Nitrososphaerota archaeon]
MKTVIDNRLAPYRKLLEGAWELQDTYGNVALTEPIIQHAAEALDQFEDWVVSTAPEPGRRQSQNATIDPEVLSGLLE